MPIIKKEAEGAGTPPSLKKQAAANNYTAETMEELLRKRYPNIYPSPEEIEFYEEEEPVNESQQQALEFLLANKDAIRFWRNATNRKPNYWWSRDEFRSCTSSEYQHDFESITRLIRLYVAAGVAISEEKNGPKQTRITFQFTQDPPDEPSTPTIVQSDTPMSLEEFEYQFVTTKNGNERARWNSECYVTLKSHNNGTKWETCINVKKMKGVWSKLVPTRKEAIINMWRVLTEPCK